MNISNLGKLICVKRDLSAGLIIHIHDIESLTGRKRDDNFGLFKQRDWYSEDKA